MTPPIQYQLLIDSLYTGNFAAPIDDITAYVIGQINWQSGMQRPYDEVADPARLTFSLTNADGAFNRETVGSELLANGTFASWTGGNPDGWTVTGESGSDPEVSQVGADATHGGSGTGSANLYSTGATLSISQGGILTVGRTYAVTLSFKTLVESTGAVVLYNGTTQISPLYHNPGDYTVVFNAVADSISVQTYGACDTTLASVSIKQTGLYRMIQKGMLVRLNSIYNNTTYPQITVRITQATFTLGLNNLPVMNIVAEDPMLRLLDKEFEPEVFVSETVTIYDRGIPITTYQSLKDIFDPIQSMFDSGIVSWPYQRSYWVLGSQGGSELGLTTYLFSEASLGFTQGPSDSYAIIGDLGDRGQGVNAQTYLRDLIGMEGGGRFYFNPRTHSFDFINRHTDAILTAGQFGPAVPVAVSFDADDLDSVDYKYGEDLVNRVTLHYSLRTVGGAGSIIWSSSQLPILLKAGSDPKTINASYFDATITTQRIAATNYIFPVAGTDIIANTLYDGSGDNVSTAISVAVDFKANSAKIILSNPTAQDCYVRTLQLRGTPLVQSDEVVTSLSADSLREFDEYPRTVEVRMLDDTDVAQSYADYIISKFKTPLDRLESITFNSLRNAKTIAAAAHMSYASVLDTLNARIAVTLPFYNHSAEYFVVGERRVIIVGGDHSQMVTLILKPQARERYWILGRTGYSELGSTTYLGF